jgi:anionic cell wall polymer biosynthesis LytR-Cps2A-Psr (LCP) family protein
MMYNTVMIMDFFKNKKRVMISFLLLTTLIGSSFATYFVFKNDDHFNENNAQVLGGTHEQPEYIPVEPPEDLNTLNILLLGYGGAGHQGGFLTDVIQVAHFDFEKGIIKFISIPRDLWVGLPNDKSAKVNTAFSLGNDANDKIGSGAQIAKQMAQTITNLKIDHYIAIDFNGYKRAIGYSLDGIEVNVPETLHDSWYPIEGKQQEPCGLTPEEIADVTNKYSGFELEKQFPCRYEEIYFPKGKNTMEGQDALNYVRSRHGSTGGDFDRSERQVAVLKGIKNKLFSLEIFDELPAFYKDVTKHTSSDIDWEIAKYLSPAIRGSKDYQIDNIVLSTENVFTNSRSNTGQFILVPKAGMNNWSAVHQHVKENL